MATGIVARQSPSRYQDCDWLGVQRHTADRSRGRSWIRLLLDQPRTGGIYSETASRLGMNPAIVEKDFWVCWILKLLFVEPVLKNQMVFKGGTSLSKVFGLIDRFSEDIDLILDWRLLGYNQEGANDPYQATSSKTQQSRHNQEMNAKAVTYIQNTLLSQLNHLFAPIPGIIARIDEDDPHTVNVFY